VHKNNEEMVANAINFKEHFWMILIPVGAVLCFVAWQIGQNVGAELGEFIFNLKH